MPSTTASAAETARPSRHKRWIPLSLRMFAAILLALGVGGTLWIGVPAYRQFLAIRGIWEGGGYVGTRPRVPRLLREWVGTEWMYLFDEVTWVDLDNTSSTDALLERCTCWTELESIDLGRSQVTDAGLGHLKGLSKLQELYLNDVHGIDEGLAHLTELPNLRVLILSRTAVTDAGLAHVKGLKRLEYLSLDNTQVTNAGVAELNLALPNLTINK